MLKEHFNSQGQIKGVPSSKKGGVQTGAGNLFILLGYSNRHTEKQAKNFQTCAECMNHAVMFEVSHIFMAMIIQSMENGSKY